MKKKVDPVKIHNEKIKTLAGIIVTEVTSFFTKNSEVLEGIIYKIQCLEESPFTSQCSNLAFTRAKITLARSFPTIFFDLFFHHRDGGLYALVDFDEKKSQKFLICRYDHKKLEFCGVNLDNKNQKLLSPECLEILREILLKFKQSWHKTRP